MDHDPDLHDHETEGGREEGAVAGGIRHSQVQLKKNNNPNAFIASFF